MHVFINLYRTCVMCYNVHVCKGQYACILSISYNVHVRVLVSLILFRTKKISIPASKVGQVVGRNSSNLSLIKLYTGANIEIEKSSRQAPNRTLIVK